MATHETDQHALCILAEGYRRDVPRLSGALHQLLGLSVLLTRRVNKARKLRKDDATDPQSMTLYHHVIWMAREGLAILDSSVMPLMDQRGPYLGGDALIVFAAKLRASFYHLFCLFHNNPPVDLGRRSARSRTSTPGRAKTPLSPKQNNGQDKPPTPPPKDFPRSNRSPATPKKRSPKDRRTEAQSSSGDKGSAQDPRLSILSNESNVTNPYGTLSALSPPPGFAGTTHQAISNTADFLLPSADFLSTTLAHFKKASELAKEKFPGSSPLRLSIALEYSAFLWDCIGDHSGSRRVAAQAIRDVYQAEEGMDDNEFEEAATLVGSLGRMMRRSADSNTPQPGPGSPGNPAVTGILSPIKGTPPPPVPILSTSTPPSLGSMQIPRRPVGTPPGARLTARRDSPAGSIPRRPVGSSRA